MSIEQIIEASVKSAFDIWAQRFITAATDAIEAAARKGNEAAARPDSTYIKVKTAAQIAEVCERTVRNWLNAGKLKRYMAGRSVRIDRLELEAFLASEVTSRNSAEVRARTLAILAQV